MTTVLGPMLGIGLAAIVIDGAHGTEAGHPAQAMPSPLWRGISRIALVCGAGIEAPLCDSVHAAARAHSPWRVGQGATERADRATIILTIAIEQGAMGSGTRRLVGEARRAVEIDDAESPYRITVDWPTGTPASAAIDTLLARLLPHRPVDRRRIE